jgi:hypothetical protein
LSFRQGLKTKQLARALARFWSDPVTADLGRDCLVAGHAFHATVDPDAFPPKGAYGATQAMIMKPLSFESVQCAAVEERGQDAPPL